MEYLKRINDRSHAPKDAYVLYDLNRGTHYVHRNDYPIFAEHWVSLRDKPHALVMDLAICQQHSLVLDIDFKSVLSTHTVFDKMIKMIISNLKIIFLPSINNFTLLFTRRKDGGGLHVHLPELMIGYDDYILFMEYLKPKMSFLHKDSNDGTVIGRFELDILTNVMLPGAAKPHFKPYEPYYLVYVDETDTVGFILGEPNSNDQFGECQKKFKRRKCNNDSLFRKFLLHGHQYATNLALFTMPVALPFQHVHRLSYATKIHNAPNESAAYEDVAFFAFKSKPGVGYICKGKQLLFDGSHYLKAFHYLRFNAITIKSFKTNNHAIEMWYKDSCMYTSHLSGQENPLFTDINQILREDNMRFENDANPVKTIMQYDKGYYFLPVFYALCKDLQMSNVELVQQLRSFLDQESYDLLDRFEAIDEKHIQYASNGLTLDTIHFCGNNLYEKPATVRDKLRIIIDESKRSILSVSTEDQMIELLRSIQEHHFPIHVLRLTNALKKQSRYLWNYLSESWQDIGKDLEITDHIVNLWRHVKSFIEEYRKQGGLGGLDKKILDSFQVRTVVSSIMSDTSFEYKSVCMNSPMWLIRLKSGTLDLRTGHCGATVPEFFMSDRKMGIELSRYDMLDKCNEDSPLTILYTHLTSKTFFFTYLKELFLDRTDDLLDTLKELVSEHLPNLMIDPLALSMMSFYVQLCKYLSFEYDLLMYFLDVLSSILIATNYERKFFVFKGTTRNGKSKLFEILAKTFGGYYHNIQAENFKPGALSTNALPELASTIFSCRIVTTDELEAKIHENRIKQITGDNQISFRNLYEQNVGGIPTAKLFTSTNNDPETITTDAFRDRVVAIPFNASFQNHAPDSTSEQVRLNEYPKESYIVEKSFEGCFFMLYFHMRQHMTPDDGLVHYRDEPECVVEYTETYLSNTDIFNQFISNMDVQIDPGSMTTMNELRSAIRQYLKASRNMAISETDLIVKFDDRFAKYRRTDIDLKAFSYTSILETARDESEPMQLENASLLEALEKDGFGMQANPLEGPSTSSKGPDDEIAPTEKDRKRPRGRGKAKSKRIKLNTDVQQQDAIVYYQDVLIKNLKRTCAVTNN